MPIFPTPLSFDALAPYVPWSRFDTVPACEDGQTDRRTGGFTIASTALYIASYADAL